MKSDPNVKLRAAALADKLIKDKKYNQETLAQAVGVSQSTLWNFLWGKTKNFGELARLADALNVSFDYLMTGSHPTTTPASVTLDKEQIKALYARTLAIIRDYGNTTTLPDQLINTMLGLAVDYDGLPNDEWQSKMQASAHALVTQWTAENPAPPTKSKK